MYGLRTLKITAYTNVRDFNVPKMVSNNVGLENLLIDIEEFTNEFGREMYGIMPSKLNNITITGKPLKYLSQYLLSVSFWISLYSTTRQSLILAANHFCIYESTTALQYEFDIYKCDII